ncbi:MAG: dihydroxy-acid dehydratase [Hyphomicrobiales bacterium]|nr:dihydroxy-acid dehydratase [Hyphomicrobiales bacterium]
MTDNPRHRSIASLRSQRWFAVDDMRAFSHRQRFQQVGYNREEFMGRPVIAILNTWSDMSPCHAHLRERAEAIKRGVYRKGGFPVEIPVISVGEIVVKPSTMLYRNFLAMEAEEALRCHPIDGAVLLGGCDKSTPGLLMGAYSMDLPVIYCPAGPMSNGQWRGQTAGAGTHTKKFWEERRAGRVSDQEWIDLETTMTRSFGTCNTIGTASTMTGIAEALGMTLPGASSIPAADSAHPRMAARCGERIVDMVLEDMKPSTFITRQSFLNAMAVWMALGGSTNAAIHMIAMAGRRGIDISLRDMAEVAARVPVLTNVYPIGSHLMEDFFFAGGMQALMRKMGAALDGTQMTVNGKTIAENCAGAPCSNDDMIRDFDNPVVPLSKGRTLVVVKGNLAPDGAVMKTSAASPHLLRHTGPALVFDSPADMAQRIEDMNLDVTADSVLVLRNAGPVGAPGMPEWGALPIPKKLLAQGVRDMVRLCDGRMSGTHYGTCVLHIAPEAAVGGPLALLKTGDMVALDAEAGTLDMLVDAAELAARRAAWTPKPAYARSYAALYQHHVSQADKGCDFDFLSAPGTVPEPPIF